MICAAANGFTSIPTTQTNTFHDFNMMATEDYYKQQEASRSKVDNMYTLTNNNNTMIPDPSINQSLNDKMSTNSLINEMNEYGKVNGHTNGSTSHIDEQRALQLALELSMLGLTNEEDMSYGDMRVKKSMNMTECVPVPSSEHVAEIVGRQGCKIKALRAKTNTYIKTPVRGEEPVFVVTGRKEDVAMAKREILQAAEHFSQIRASRRNSSSLSPLGSPSPTAPGHITKQVRVPYRVVGLVVGPKGSTIKRIQQATNTYIVTPSRDKEPVFEVTGLPENVDRAKREVEQHIALRTGGIIDPTHPESNDHLLNGFSSSLFSPSSSSSGASFSALLDHHNHPGGGPLGQRSHSMDSFNYFNGQSSASSKFSELSSATSPFSNNAFFYDTVIPSPTTEMENTIGQFDPAPGSPAQSLWPEMLQRNTSINRAVGSQPQSRSMSVNTYSSSDNSGRSSPAQYRRLLSEPGNDAYPGLQSSYSHFTGTAVPSTVQSPIGPETTSIIDMAKITTSDGESQSSSPDWLGPNKQATNLPNIMATKKQCCVCQSNKVVAALVPCGHNLFCMECAEQVKEAEGECPACQKKVEAVLRIFS